MARKDLYREVYEDFKYLCSQGIQPGSFYSYCHSRKVSYHHLCKTLGKEYRGVRGLPGYTSQKAPTNEEEYMQVYENFKQLCGRGNPPVSFGRYCESLGYDRWCLYNFLHRRKLSVSEVPGYINPASRRGRYEEIPFEKVIFEEAGFLRADGIHVISIQVDGRVSVSFPADTDIDTIAKFVKKLGKEVNHVGP